MTRLLPVVALLAVFLGTLVFFRYFKQTDKLVIKPLITENTPAVVSSPSGQFIPQPQSSTDNRVKQLEEAVTLLVKKVNDLSAAKTPVVETRLKTLEDKVTVLQTQVSSPTQAPAVTPVAVKKAPVYIPLGSGGVRNDQDWWALSSYEISIDPSEYAGYTSMQMEVTMRLWETSGTAFARLYNYTDGKEIQNSEVNVTQDVATLATSYYFQLPTGKKTYRLQVKSTQGFNVELENARIKVNF